MGGTPVTVVETGEFQRRAAELLSPPEVMRLIQHLAYHPTAGVVIPGTGGVRKLRWGVAGKGKRGGARVIYYYLDDHAPIFLFTAYAKSAKPDLTGRERQALRRTVAEIAAHYRGRAP